MHIYNVIIYVQIINHACIHSSINIDFYDIVLPNIQAYAYFVIIIHRSYVYVFEYSKYNYLCEKNIKKMINHVHIIKTPNSH